MPDGKPLGIQHWSIVDVSEPHTFLNFDLPIPSEDGDLFCSGHAWTKDGDLFVAGGDLYFNGDSPASDPAAPNTLAYRFRPASGTPGNSWWVREPDLSVPRWYPTVTALGTDEDEKDILLVMGGNIGEAVNTYEAFDPSGLPGPGSWQIVPESGADRVFDGPSGPWPTPECANSTNLLDIYPRAFLVTSGKVFFAGMSGLPYRLDHTSRMNDVLPPVWEIPTTEPIPLLRKYCSAFLYPNLGGPDSDYKNVVVRVGGEEVPYSVLGGHCFANNGDAGESNVTEWCDAAESDPAWGTTLPDLPGPPAVSPMNHARLFPNTVLLPDASVLVFSACQLSGGGEPSSEGTPVLKAEIFNDDPSAPNSWREVASASVFRGYHSAAVLLPDGRVLVGGSENRQQINNEGPSDYEVFQPHYLTNGTQRPQILSAPSTLSYGGNYTVTYAAMTGGVHVDRAVLMAPGSVTHHTDMHQRYVELKRLNLQGPPGPNPTFRFKAPPSSTHAPRGYYMLFLVTSVQPGANRRAPSIATWVELQ